MTEAYHCSALTEAKREFLDAIGAFDFKQPSIAVYRNVDGQVYSRENIASGLTDHFDHTVLFYDSICNALNMVGSDNRNTTIFDIGSNGYLSKCVADIEAERNEKYEVIKFDS